MQNAVSDTQFKGAYFLDDIIMAFPSVNQSEYSFLTTVRYLANHGLAYKAIFDAHYLPSSP